jgi:hypothetical protein
MVDQPRETGPWDVPELESGFFGCSVESERSPTILDGPGNAALSRSPGPAFAEKLIPSPRLDRDGE